MPDLTLKALRIETAAGELWLSAAKAAYCPAERALFVADVHLGKALSFRSLGVPVPSGTTAATLARLDRLLTEFDVKTLFVLGDLLHGPAVRNSSVIEQLAQWRHERPNLELVLIRGNHDNRAGDPPPHCGIAVLDEGLSVGPWVLRHHPANEKSGFSLCGHLHPCYRLNGRVDSVRLPAFWFRDHSAVLPAFGDFTGGMQPELSVGDRIFITDGERVYGVPQRGGLAA